MEITPGATLDGRYAVEAPVGQGGMASVWRVRHVHLGSHHALKVLHISTAEMRERLLEEGRIQARLSHPNIVPVTDVVTLSGGVALVMPLVSGPSLRAYLGRGPVPLAQALALGAGIIDGVAHAHAAGLIHRDLKPENILLQQLGGEHLPRVADFGLARALGRAGPQRTRTRVGMGTPGYMAPEQYRDVTSVDARADVFSLGCVLYELLTGRRPFDGSDVLALYQQTLRGEFPPPERLRPELPLPLAALLSQCLRPRPVERLADAGALSERWRAAADLPPALAVAPPPRAPAPAALAAETLGTFSTLPPSGDPAPLAGPDLPLPQDTFVGREREQSQLQALIDGGGGVITVLGPGGAGKTRLCLEVARAQHRRFSGGVLFCDLSEARTPEGIYFVVSSALDLPLEGDDPAGQLGRAIAGRAAGAPGGVLVVLDNFEQIVDYAPQTLGRWRQDAPGAVFLVTSRVVLGLRGEKVFALGPLAADDAVELFAFRASFHSRSFALTDDQRPDVEALVDLLDRLPLAIELAAARARVMTPAAMASRMGQRFRLLSGGKRSDSARQVTLRGAIDWSWDLLDDWEKAALAQCSVFEGGFTLEAAEAVLDLSMFDAEPWPVDAIQSLVDKSLLVPEAVGAFGGRGGREPRFRMYLSIQDYAAEKLDQPEPIRARHGQYFAGFGHTEARAALDMHGGVDRWWAFSAELGNLVAAARRAVTRGDEVTATGAAFAASDVLKRRGLSSTADELLGQVQLLLERGDASESSRRAASLAELRHERGNLCYNQGLLEEGVAHFEAALALRRELGDRTGEARTLGNLGALYRVLGRMEEALSHYEASLARHREIGDRPQQARVLCNLGVLHIRQGRRGEAREHYEAAVEILRAIGDRAREGVVLGNLGVLCWNEGQLDQAATCFQAALDISRRSGERVLEGNMLRSLGVVLKDRGRLDEAKAHLEASLAIQRELGDSRFEGFVQEALGALCIARSQLDEAAAYLEAALKKHREVGNRQAEGSVRSALGAVAYDQGHEGLARAHFEEALAIQREVGDRAGEGLAMGYLGLISAARGELEGAEMFERGEALLREVEARRELCTLLVLRADVERRLGQPEVALVTFRRAEALATESGAGSEMELSRRLSTLREKLQ
jgi:predicted ATPase